ncbi:MAG: BatA and WFA domain-containing protein [Pseudomonadota bacterium]
MIGFAQPWALLTLVSLPLIILLYRIRPKRQDAVVSSLQFWHQAVRIRDRHRRFHRVLRDLNLLLLLALALCLGLALAQPHWQVSTQSSTDAVLIIDTSASMNTRVNALGRTRFDEARAKAADIIDALPTDGRLLIMTSGRAPRALSGFESDRERLQATLRAIEPTHEAGDPDAAFTLARSLLRGRQQAQLHFVTDGAFDAASRFSTAGSDIHVVGNPQDNVAITRFNLRTSLHAEAVYDAFIEVRNVSDDPVTAPLSLSIDSTLQSQQDISLAANSATTLLIPVSVTPRGRATAQVQVDDALAVDNTAWMGFAPVFSRRILLLTPGNFYLETALRALPDTRLDVITQPEGAPADPEQRAAELRGYDVVVFDRIPVPELGRGNFLLVDTAPAGSPFAVAQRGDAVGVDGTDNSHVMQDLELSQVRINAPRLVSADTLPGWQRLFWTSDADLAVRRLQPGQRQIVLGFDLLNSNFPHQTAFPLFIRKSIEWLAAPGFSLATGPGGDRSRQVAAGEPFTLAFPPHTDEVLIASPDGDAEAVALDAPRYTFADTSKTGLYQYSIAGVRHYIAANLTDAAESNITQRVSAAAVTATPPDAELTGITQQPLWPYLAWCALALLLAEWGVWCGRGHA